MSVALAWHWALSASSSSDTGHRSVGGECNTPGPSLALCASWKVAAIINPLSFDVADVYTFFSPPGKRGPVLPTQREAHL